MPSLKTYYLRCQLHEIHKVTERRDGLVYRTLCIGKIVGRPEYIQSLLTPDIQQVSLSTQYTKHLLKGTSEN